MLLTRLAAVTLIAALSVACSSTDPARPNSSASSTTSPLPLAKSSLAPETPSSYALGIHCGARILGLINGQVWRAAEGDDIHQWIPAEWATDLAVRPDGPILLEVSLSSDEQTITASFNGRAVEYAPGGSEFKAEDLCA